MPTLITHENLRFFTYSDVKGRTERFGYGATLVTRLHVSINVELKKKKKKINDDDRLVRCKTTLV